MRRIASFDIAKAVALLAVIVGHCSFMGMPTTLVRASYSVSIPLFFIISGYFTRDMPPSVADARRQARSLLAPYIVTSLIVILLMALRAVLLKEGSFAGTVLLWLKAALFGSGARPSSMIPDIPAIGAIWYLLALFWARIILQALRSTRHAGVLSLCLFYVGVVTKESVWLPWSIQPALCAVLFLYIGQEVRSGGYLEPGAVPAALWALLVFVWLYCIRYAGELYLVEASFKHGALDVIGGVAGSLIVLRLSALFADRFVYPASVAAAVGRITLPLFCMHLVGLNVMRWDLILAALGGPSRVASVVALGVNLAMMVGLSAILYTLPRPVSGLFYPSRRVSAQV